MQNLSKTRLAHMWAKWRRSGAVKTLKQNSFSKTIHHSASTIPAWPDPGDGATIQLPGGTFTIKPGSRFEIRVKQFVNGTGDW